MNHSAVVKKMQMFKDAVQYLNKKSPKIPLDLAEVGSALGQGKDAFEIEGVFGSALWQVDMMLYAMAIGVRRVNYQSIIGANFSLWQPEQYASMPPHVRPPYYAQIFAAEFIGHSNVNVTNVDLHNDHLSAYAAYKSSDGGKLSRVAIVNLKAWNAHSGEPIPVMHVSLPVPSGTKDVQVKLLTSKTGANDSAEDDISWAGETYTYDNRGLGHKTGTNGSETVDVIDGKATISVRASEAVIVEL